MNNVFNISNQAGKAFVQITGSISYWENNSKDFTQRVNRLLSDGIKDIHADINCYGGDMTQANEIGNQIERFPGSKSCKLGAIVASAGFTLITYFDYDKIEASSNTQGMFHDPTWRPLISHLEDFDSQKALYENLRNDVINRFHDMTGITKEQLSNDMKKTTWMNAENLKKKGFVKGVLQTKSKAPTGAKNYLNNSGIDFPSNLLFESENTEEFEIKNLTQDTDMKECAKNLGLPEDATETQIIDAQNKLKAQADAGKKSLVNLAKEKGIDEELINVYVANDFNKAVAYVENHKAPENNDGGEGAEGGDDKSKNPDNLRVSNILEALKNQGGQKPSNEVKKFEDYSESELRNMEDNEPEKFQKLFNESDFAKVENPVG